MRMRCSCDNILCNNIAPNEMELVVYTDEEWAEALKGSPYHWTEAPDPEIYDMVWRCPECKRIMLLKLGNAEKVFALEAPPAGAQERAAAPHLGLGVAKELRCRCGNLLTEKGRPNGTELMVYGDIEWDEYTNSKIIDMRKLPAPKYRVWLCPECQRIYVLDRRSYRVVQVYYLERDHSQDRTPKGGE